MVQYLSQKSEVRSPMEVVRWKTEEGKKEEGKKKEGKKQLFRIPHALFCQCPMPCFANAQEHLISLKKAIQLTQYCNCFLRKSTKKRLRYYHGEPTFRWTLSNH